MIFDNADLAFARDTLRSFIDSVALSRAIRGLEEHAYSFTVAQIAAFDTAAISWCILFGSDNAEQQRLHWKNMFAPDPFREGLLHSVGMTLDDWTAYRQGVVDYRNELAVHRDLDPTTRFHPNFDKALLAADFYHQRLCDKIAAQTGLQTDGGALIEQYTDRLDLFTQQMAVAVASVKAWRR
jgi:hypothetical protein